MSGADSKRSVFRDLHRAGCFVIPNPWDPGSARYLESLGFPALATTSAGFAWTRGLPDNLVPLEEVLRHLAEIAASVSVPVNADFEGGFAVEPEDVAANVRRAIATGIAGISIEDSTRDDTQPLFEFGLAVERVRAAAEAARGTGVVLTARSEGFLAGRPDLEETLRRLTAYAGAGAECLYAPGLASLDDIATVVRAVAPVAVNVLDRGAFTVADLARRGVRRVSVGGALARTAWHGFMAAATEIAREGRFDGVGSAASADVNGLFTRLAKESALG